MTAILDLEAIKAANVKQQPYPYFVVSKAIQSAQLGNLINDFPAISKGGSFALESLELAPLYEQLAQEFADQPLRQIIEDKLDLDLEGRPAMVTARGHSRAKDGRIHTDSKSKLVTLLLYLNESWQQSTGNLRILNSGDNLENYAEEIPSHAGTLLVFKVTDNCWHGYPSFEGKRCSLQINYVTSDAAASKHNRLHRLSAKVKGWFS